MLYGVLLIIVLIILDQGTKYLALLYLKPVDTIPLISNVFELAFVENRGAAFGILRGQRWLFIILTSIILCGIFYYYRKLPHEKPYGWIRFCIFLISAGAVGNFIDRIRMGFVIDFFHFYLIEWPVFNMADIYVVVGTILLSYFLLFVIKDPEEKGN